MRGEYEIQELEARIEALEADNRRLQSCIDEREDALRTITNPWANQLARIEELEKVLRKYSTHTSDCGYRYGHDCDCGIAEIRTALAEGQDKQADDELDATIEEMKRRHDT